MMDKTDVFYESQTFQDTCCCKIHKQHLSAEVFGLIVTRDYNVLLKSGARPIYTMVYSLLNCG